MPPAAGTTPKRLTGGSVKLSPVSAAGIPLLQGEEDVNGRSAANRFFVRGKSWRTPRELTPVGEVSVSGLRTLAVLQRVVPAAVCADVA